MNCPALRCEPAEHVFSVWVTVFSVWVAGIGHQFYKSMRSSRLYSPSPHRACTVCTTPHSITIPTDENLAQLIHWMKELPSTFQLSWPEYEGKTTLKSCMQMLSYEWNPPVLLPSIHPKKLFRVYTQKSYSEGDHWQNSQPISDLVKNGDGRDWEEERNCERKICSAESWPSCPPISTARLSGSKSMSAWLLTPLLIKADIIWAATDPYDRQHLMGAVPTGYGKSLPMLVAALLLPPGEPPVDRSAFLWCPSNFDNNCGCF